MPRRVGHDGCPVGSCAIERQYGEGNASRRPVCCKQGEGTMIQEAVAWFVGVDWGSEKHQVCVLDGHGAIVGERVFLHSGAGLAELGDWLPRWQARQTPSP